MANLTEAVVNKIENNLKCYGVFLDLSKAFDTVSIPKLLSKLEKIGVRGTALDMFTSYLTNRTQVVKIGNYISSEEKLCYGVPQGSILGPTLFLTYINQLCNMTIEGCSIFTYADDTALIVHGKNWENAKLNAMNAIQTITEWLSENLLTLNLSKTQLIRFDISKNKIYNPDLDTIPIHFLCDSNRTPCDCPTLRAVKSVKYLGIHLDERLDWHIQIDKLTARTRRLLYLFKTLRNSADKSTLLTAYFALCQSVISYCISVWGGAHKTSMIKLERAQRAILKVMLRKKRTYQTVKLYSECEVLTVRQLSILWTTLRIHSALPYNPKHAEKRKGASICPLIKCRTTWAKRQWYALGTK